MAMKTTRAQESHRKPKPRTVAPDFRAFLEEIDPPQWVDLALQRNSDGERDDSWFDMLHPFHQCSFQDLVSPGVKVKGRGYVSAGKLSSFKTHSNDSLRANSVFYKPSNSTEVESFTTVSTSSDNESRNPMVRKSESSRACDLQNRPIVPQHTTTVPRSNGLVASLKLINLRRSAGALPALRVEVKGQQQSRNGRSSASKFNIVDEKSRKDCESANAENKTALAKMKTKTVLTAKLAPG